MIFRSIRKILYIFSFSVPSAPQDIKITSSKPGFVCIEWSAPAIPNGKITSYIIQYSDTPDIEDEEWNKVEKNGK